MTDRAAAQAALTRLFADYPDLLRDDGGGANAQRALAALLAPLHEADAADLLEARPPDERRALWAAIPAARRGAVLSETSDAVTEALLEETPEAELAPGFAEMEINDVAMLLRAASPLTRARLMRISGLADDPDLRASLSFAEDSVGGLMDFAAVIARADDTVAAINRGLRARGELPSHCDKLFVVDQSDRLCGVLPLKRLLLNAPNRRAREIMIGEDVRVLRPAESVAAAADFFERYDLISAPVTDARGRIVGRVTIDEILDHAQSERDRALLSAAGVAEEEDIFAPIGRRMRNRWSWIFINLIAVFAVSWVVGLFERTIAELAILAALMPIVAGLAGGVANQTATLLIRGLALNIVNAGNWRAVMKSEATLGLAGGALWGAVSAALAYALHDDAALALVLGVAMLLGFIVAAAAGFAVPLAMQKIGRDPALGATVVLTAITDSAGFFIFLGLAAAFLV